MMELEEYYTLDEALKLYALMVMTQSMGCLKIANTAGRR